MCIFFLDILQMLNMYLTYPHIHTFLVFADEMNRPNSLIPFLIVLLIIIIMAVFVLLVILIAKLQRGKQCFCKGNAFYLLLFLISAIRGNDHLFLFV